MTRHNPKSQAGDLAPRAIPPRHDLELGVAFGKTSLCLILFTGKWRIKG
jgi:hypothetical protein